MVDYLDIYNELLRRGVAAFDELLALYAPDKQTEKDWADISLSDTRNQRRSFMERLADPPVRLTAEETSSVALSVRQYVESHWADYHEYPIKSVEKRARIEALHAQLKAVADGIGQIYNALRVG